jgi:sugar (pentulose or hexulose) kinase
MLKFGYHLIKGGWPSFLADIGLDEGKFPRVARSGDVIGTVRPALADRYGFSREAVVCAGMTDGCASQVSTGAVSPGAWCSTIGTTLVVKGVSSRLLTDPLGRVYSHRHPEGYWLPGGASNTGAECLKVRYGNRTALLSDRARGAGPSGQVSYPLVKRGERFPFVCPEAEGFSVEAGAGPEGMDEELRGFISDLEGVGFVERLAYEMLSDLGFKVGEAICTSGGGARSPAWVQIRADILGRSILKPAAPSAAVGAAVLAASRTAFRGLRAAADSMVRIESVTSPRDELVGRYDALYGRFLDEMRSRGYVGKAAEG